MALQKRVPPSLTWSKITDFTVNHGPTTEFRLSAHLDDPTGDLASVTIQASIGTVAVPLFVGPVAGREAEVVSVFRLGDGDWNVVARVVDQSGRVTEAGLTEIGGSDVVTLRVHAAGTTQMANPVAVPRGGYFDARPNVVLTCSSAGSEIRYSVVALGAAPGTYSVYSAPISMPLNHTLYVHAVDVVGSAESSEVVRHDNRLVPYTESGPSPLPRLRARGNATRTDGAGGATQPPSPFGQQILSLFRRPFCHTGPEDVERPVEMRHRRLSCKRRNRETTVGKEEGLIAKRSSPWKPIGGNIQAVGMNSLSPWQTAGD